MPNILQTGMEVLNKDLVTLPPNAKAAMITMADKNSIRWGMVWKFESGWHMSAELVKQWDLKKPDAVVTIGKVWMK